MPDGIYRTSDMALTTYLKLEGYTPQEIKWQGGTCYWWFDKTEALVAAVDAFLGKESRVEPTEYNRVFSQTKREFYDNKPVASAAS